MMRGVDVVGYSTKPSNRRFYPGFEGSSARVLHGSPPGYIDAGSQVSSKMPCDLNVTLIWHVV